MAPTCFLETEKMKSWFLLSWLRLKFIAVGRSCPREFSRGIQHCKKSWRDSAKRCLLWISLSNRVQSAFSSLLFLHMHPSPPGGANISGRELHRVLAGLTFLHSPARRQSSSKDKRQMHQTHQLPLQLLHDESNVKIWKICPSGGKWIDR